MATPANISAESVLDAAPNATDGAENVAPQESDTAMPSARSEDEDDDDDYDDEENMYLLHDIVEQGALERLHKLLPHRQKEVEKKQQQETQSFYPTSSMNLESSLLEKDDMGCLPVHVALIYQRKECFTHMMQYSSALAVAMMRMKCADLNTPFVHLILRVGAMNPSFATDILQELCDAKMYHEDVHAQLLDRMALRDEEGNTVFHLCAMYDLVECFDTLVAFHKRMTQTDDDAGEKERNTLLEKPNRIGYRPLHSAMKFESRLMARKLLVNRANVNALTSLQQTPAHVAAFFGFTEGIQMLLGHKATAVNWKAKDKHGYIALDIAQRCKFTRISKLLASVYPDRGSESPEEQDAQQKSKTCFLYPPEALRHLPLAYHRRGGPEPPPENPERVETLVDPIVGILHSKEFQKDHIEWDTAIERADIADILRVHEYHYVDKIRHHCESLKIDDDEDDEESGKTFVLDPDTTLSLRSYEAASRAAGAVCKAVDHVVQGKYTNAFCVVRPPGHHAGPVGKVTCKNDPEGSHGFCLFNNVAVGAAYARAHYKHQGINRIAILDFDVHHGNGTEEIIQQLVPSTRQLRYETPYGEGVQVVHTYKPWRNEQDADNVFFCSVHGYGHKDPEKEYSAAVQQAWFYPGSGETTNPAPAADQNDKAAPLIWNVGLEYCQEGSSTSRLKWRSVFRDQILTQLCKFKPDLIFLSAGFDAHKKEQVNWGYLALLEQDYEWLLHHVKQVANTCCNGRLISVLEGGYNFHGRMASPFARSVAAHARALALRTGETWDPQEIAKEAQYEQDLLQQYLTPGTPRTPTGTPTGPMMKIMKKRPAPVPSDPKEDEQPQLTSKPMVVARSKRARKQVDYVALAKELANEGA